MSVPEHLWRFPTKEAIQSLAERFGHLNHPDMQDWEIEVADPSRIREFLLAYESGELNDDERFTLMETIIQSFEDSDRDLDDDDEWNVVIGCLDRFSVLHGYTIWYWSCPESKSPEEGWRVTQRIRRVLAKRKHTLSGGQ